MTSALVLTRDPAVREEVVRIASAAGVEVAAPLDIGAAGGDWMRAAVVVVGADAAEEVAAAGWSRRGGVLVMSWGPPLDAVFRPALALGAEAVLEMPVGTAHLAECLADAGEGRISRAIVIGVIGGSGGVGATTLAAALAQAAAPGRRVLLIDADVLGPGLDQIFGTAAVGGLRWSELHGSSGRLGGRAVRDALPRLGELPFLTWQGAGRMPSPELLREVTSSARRANDLVVIDIGRSLDAMAAEALASCDLVLVVVRPTPDGISSARRLAVQLPDPGRARAVVRGRRGEQDDVGLGVAAWVGRDRRIGEAIALGMGPLRSRRSPLGRGVQAILEWLQGGPT